MRDVDLLVTAEYLYPMSAGLPIWRDAEVAIVGDRIVHAGPRKPDGTWRPKRTLGGPSTAVLPGFVNCHTHVASIVFRGRTDDNSRGVGLYDVAFRMEKFIGREEWRDLSWAGAVEMIRAGFTSVNDLWYAPDLLAEACVATGLRATIANKVFDVKLENLSSDDYTHYQEIGAARLQEGVDFAERWHGREGGRILARLGPHASDTCAPEFHRAIRAEADRLKLGLHVHTAQSRREVAEIARSRGRGPLEYLRELGVLRADTTIAHLTFASDADLDAVAASGAHYAHCPTIYPRRGRYPRFPEIVGRGIQTGFATDWMQNDPFEAMRYAISALRLLAGDADVMSCREALARGTIEAARVMGLGDEIGSLEPGKKADLVLVDLDRPHLQPFYGDYAALVFYARADDVVTSIVDGAIVMEDRRLVRVDEAPIRAAIATHRPAWHRRLVSLGAGI
ncbi:MAG: amidohydrolase family protein [Alphaproteobacteria bacterium]|nr:amidohydrolase family protein [Alphaproteobacteria bacterium]